METPAREGRPPRPVPSQAPPHARIGRRRSRSIRDLPRRAREKTAPPPPTPCGLCPAAPCGGGAARGGGGRWPAAEALSSARAAPGRATRGRFRSSSCKVVISRLFVIPSFPHHSQYKVDLSSMSYSLIESKQRDIYFSAVFRAGGDIVAIGDKLMAVYTLDRQTLQWVHRPTSGDLDLDLEQEIKVSGYADIGDSKFLISDFDTERCFLCDLRHDQWFVVEPPIMTRWLGEIGLLNGRCIFAEGFIYACWDEGLEAYELVRDDGKFILGAPIVLEFPWQKFSDRRFMSFERINKEESIPGGVVFCVIQGHFTADPFTDSHSLTATTVVVERQDAPGGEKRPVRIKHIDVAVSSVHHEEPILTNYAFAL